MKKVLLLLAVIIFSTTIGRAQQTGKEKIAAIVSILNEDCPIAFDDDLLVTRITVNNQYLVFDCTNDESEVSMSDVMLLKDELKEAFGEILELMASDDEDFAALLYGVSSEGLGVQFKMHGATSKQILDTNFTPEEIEELLFGDFMLNNIEPLNFDDIDF